MHSNNPSKHALKVFYPSSLCILLLLIAQGCSSVNKINTIQSNEIKLNPTDVVLFTGFNMNDSQTSQTMLSQTKEILEAYGVETQYLQDKEVQERLLRLAITSYNGSTQQQADPASIIFKSGGFDYIFSVVDVNEFEEGINSIDGFEKVKVNSGIVFLVYATTEQKVIASYQLAGKSMSEDEKANRHILTNYVKVIHKLIKTSK